MPLANGVPACALHNERVIAVRAEPNPHLEFHQRSVTGARRSPLKLLAGVVHTFFEEVIKLAKQLELNVQCLVGSI